MNIEHFEREKGFKIPLAEVVIENESLFAHYDIRKDEPKQTDNENGRMSMADNGNDPYVACYIRIPHVATLESIKKAIEDNGCDDADKVAEEIYRLYMEEYKY